MCYFFWFSQQLCEIVALSCPWVNGDLVSFIIWPAILLACSRVELWTQALTYTRVAHIHIGDSLGYIALLDYKMLCVYYYFVCLLTILFSRWCVYYYPSCFQGRQTQKGWILNKNLQFDLAERCINKNLSWTLELESGDQMKISNSWNELLVFKCL